MCFWPFFNDAKWTSTSLDWELWLWWALILKILNAHERTKELGFGMICKFWKSLTNLIMINNNQRTILKENVNAQNVIRLWDWANDVALLLQENSWEIQTWAANWHWFESVTPEKATRKTNPKFWLSWLEENAYHLLPLLLLAYVCFLCLNMLFIIFF